MPLSYPYPPPPPGQTHHLLQTRIPETDYRFLKRLLPYVDGLNHIILSNLVKKFIDELRKLDSVSKLEPTLYPGDPTHILIERVLDGITFRPVGSESGADDERGTGGVREEMRGPTKQRTESKGGTEKRRRKPRRTEDKEKGRKERPVTTGDGTSS